MTKTTRIFTMVVLLAFGILIGDMAKRVYSPVVEPEPVSIVEEVKEQAVDTFPLENQGEINIAVVNGVKTISMTLEDFEYVVKKKRTYKKVLENLTALFKRLD